ncbi:MAG: family intrarane metalloprotease [Ferruginibacter sp.]|nr:family intrarane metalloprotease [Ferruginibacter sp.]
MNSLSVFFKYLHSFYHTAFKGWYFFIVVLMMSALLYVNYFQFPLSQKSITYGHWGADFSTSYFLYFTPFAAAFILQYFFFAHKAFFKNPWFIALVLLAPAFFALRVNMHLQQELVTRFVSGDALIAWNACINWIVRAMLVIALVWIIWHIKDRHGEKFYGTASLPGSWKPYLLLLLMMVPLICIAATQPDFLHRYPRAQILESLPIKYKTFTYLCYELAYGFDFISIEIFFRGFLIVAFMRLCGMQCIIPAACFYCCIHLGKPLGEAISSFFGGILLGLVSYHTKSIRGGLLIHLGIAWAMELAGLIAHRLA